MKFNREKKFLHVNQFIRVVSFSGPPSGPIIPKCFWKAIYPILMMLLNYFCQDSFHHFVCRFDLLISLKMIRSRYPMFDLIFLGQGLNKFGGELCNLIHNYPLRHLKLSENILIKEIYYFLFGSSRKIFSIHPF